MGVDAVDAGGLAESLESDFDAVGCEGLAAAVGEPQVRQLGALVLRAGAQVARERSGCTRSEPYPAVAGALAGKVDGLGAHVEVVEVEVADFG